MRALISAHKSGPNWYNEHAPTEVAAECSWSGSRPAQTRRAASGRRRPWSIWRPIWPSPGDPTLVIDIDPQGNATSGLGVDRRSLDRSIYDSSSTRAPVEELVIGTAIDGLDLSRRRPDCQEPKWSCAVAARERRLAASLASLNGRYERVLIDCPPSLGLLTVNALTAADGVLIPIQTEYYALEGLSQLVNTIRLVREGLNPRLEIDGVSADDVRRPHPPLRAGGGRGPPAHEREASTTRSCHAASGSPRRRAMACRSRSTIRRRAARRLTRARRRRSLPVAEEGRPRGFGLGGASTP